MQTMWWFKGVVHHFFFWISVLCCSKLAWVLLLSGTRKVHFWREWGQRLLNFNMPTKTSSNYYKSDWCRWHAKFCGPWRHTIAFWEERNKLHHDSFKIFTSIPALLKTRGQDQFDSQMNHSDLYRICLSLKKQFNNKTWTALSCCD